jgi:hypothetical protein
LPYGGGHCQGGTPAVPPPGQYAFLDASHVSLLSLLPALAGFWLVDLGSS